MEQRINFLEKGPAALKTLFHTGAYLKKSLIEQGLQELVEYRVSQINGCAYCLDMHSKDAIAHGESAQRLFCVSAWRETPFFNDREKAALAWAEAVNACNIPDAIFTSVKEQFTDEELIDLTLVITSINAWNRFNIAFTTPATVGTYQAGQFG